MLYAEVQFFGEPVPIEKIQATANAAEKNSGISIAMWEKIVHDYRLQPSRRMLPCPADNAYLAPEITPNTVNKDLATITMCLLPDVQEAHVTLTTYDRPRRFGGNPSSFQEQVISGVLEEPDQEYTSASIVIPGKYLAGAKPGDFCIAVVRLFPSAIHPNERQ